MNDVIWACLAPVIFPAVLVVTLLFWSGVARVICYFSKNTEMNVATEIEEDARLYVDEDGVYWLNGKRYEQA